MSRYNSETKTLINGTPARAGDLSPIAFAGFAHFTAMQIRNGSVKALDLHLARLRNASMDLFGAAPNDELIIDSIRSALRTGPQGLSLTVTAFAPEGEFTTESFGSEPSVLVRTSLPSDGPQGPMKLWITEHERHMARIKHVGEWAKTYFLHRAAEHGFDDVAFMDRNGRLSEGSIWNLVFWDGSSVVWPQADILVGTMMGMVQRQLEELGVTQRVQVVRSADLAWMEGAAVMNSWTPGVPLTAIGDHNFPVSEALMSLLRAAYAAEPYYRLK